MAWWSALKTYLAHQHTQGYRPWFFTMAHRGESKLTEDDRVQLEAFQANMKEAFQTAQQEEQEAEVPVSVGLPVSICMEQGVAYVRRVEEETVNVNATTSGFLALAHLINLM